MKADKTNDPLDQLIAIAEKAPESPLDYANTSSKFTRRSKQKKSSFRSYSDKLKDPKWQRKRLEIMERDEFTCQWCGSSKETLHVHHINYEKGADPWAYGDDNFITLCADCHERAEKVIRFFRSMFKSKHAGAWGPANNNLVTIVERAMDAKERMVRSSNEVPTEYFMIQQLAESLNRLKPGSYLEKQSPEFPESEQ